MPLLSIIHPLVIFSLFRHCGLSRGSSTSCQMLSELADSPPLEDVSDVQRCRRRLNSTIDISDGGESSPRGVGSCAPPPPPWSTSPCCLHLASSPTLRVRAHGSELTLFPFLLRSFTVNSAGASYVTDPKVFLLLLCHQSPSALTNKSEKSKLKCAHCGEAPRTDALMEMWPSSSSVRH